MHATITEQWEKMGKKLFSKEFLADLWSTKPDTSRILHDTRDGNYELVSVNNKEFISDGLENMTCRKSKDEKHENSQIYIFFSSNKCFTHYGW